MTDFRDLKTGKQIERFKARPDAERAIALVEETMLKLKAGRINHARASTVLRVVADFLDECAVVVSHRNITKT